MRQAAELTPDGPDLAPAADATRILMLSTTDIAGGRRDLLERMLASVAAFAAERPDVPLTMILLAQNAGANEPAWPPFAVVQRVPGRLSLSAARNYMLAEARRRGLLDARTVVLFPDDDCWYPPGALSAIHAAFASRPDLDLWFCRYASTPVEASTASDRPASAAETARRASSNTIAVRGHLLAAGLAFDESLGVGTPNGGGEDTDFALAALGRARVALFRDAACIGHRDSDPSFVARYYRGALLALAANADISGVAREYHRKLLVGLYFLLRGRLGPGPYVRAVTASFGRLRRRR